MSADWMEKVQTFATTLQSTTLVLLVPNRKTVHPLYRKRISAKMGGLPSSTGQLPSAADGSRIDATPTAREESSHLTGCPPGIMGEEGK